MSMKLIKLKSWFASNKLSLNISKTNYTVFVKVDKDELINVSIDGFIRTRVCSTKFRGVQIEGLNWKEDKKIVNSKLIKVSAHFQNKVCVKLYRAYIKGLLFIISSIYKLLFRNMGKHLQN